MNKEGIVKIAKIVQALTYWPIYGTLRILTRYQVEGQENLKGLENQGIIFASNHTSYVDGPICAACMPRASWYPHEFFPIRFMAWKKFFKWFNPFLPPLSFFVAAYVRYNGSVPVERAGGDLLRALRYAIEALKTGDKLWIYPEGGITKDGKLQQGKRGVAFLHKQTKAPIVPVALIGTHKTFRFPKIFSTLLRKNKITVRIGKPIYDLGNVSLEEGTEKIMKSIGELMV